MIFTSKENYLTLDEDTDLFYQIWDVPKPKGTVIITHGIGEHSSCYQLLASKLNKNKWQVIGWDLRGHGYSSGQRGYVDQFSDHCSDFKKIVKQVTKEHHPEGLPLVLFSHSMGAAITLLTHAKIALKNVSAFCLSSPALGVDKQPPQAKEALSQFADKFIPRLTINNEIDPEDLSQIPEQIQSYERDNLRHNKINSRTYYGILEASKKVFQKIDKFNTPLLLQIAGKESIVSNKQSNRFFRKLKIENKKLVFF